MHLIHEDWELDLLPKYESNNRSSSTMTTNDPETGIDPSPETWFTSSDTSDN
jgi:hypothetical protein